MPTEIIRMMNHPTATVHAYVPAFHWPKYKLEFMNTSYDGMRVVPRVPDSGILTHPLVPNYYMVLKWPSKVRAQSLPTADAHLRKTLDPCLFFRPESSPQVD